MAHVLIIDDEPAIMRVIARILTRAGHVVTTTEPAGALALLGEPFIEVVISDYTGHPVQEWIAASSAPVLIHTGDDRVRAVEGAAGVLSKPASPEELCQWVERLVGR